MSVEVMGLVWKMDLPSTDKLILLKLADHAHEDGTRIYPSINSTATRCGVSRRTVQRTLRQFEADKLLIRVNRGDGGRGHATEYNIDLERASLWRGRHGDAGVIDDSKGRHGDAPTIRNRPKKEKSRLRRILDSEKERNWLAGFAPEYDFDDEAAAWDDRNTAHPDKAPAPTAEAEAASFRGWIRNKKSRDKPKGKAKPSPKDLGPIEPVLVNGILPEMEKAWQECHRRLAKSIGAASWDSWLRQCRYSQKEGDVALIQVPSDFHQGYIRDNFGVEAERHLSASLGRPVRIEFEIKEELAA